MITLELYARNTNTRYLQYDPTKYCVSIESLGEGPYLDVKGFGIGLCAGAKKSYGPFRSVSIRHSSPPSYVDIIIWD